LSERKPFRRFQKRVPSLTAEQKIEQFILRNSKNGYFTKVSTISYKFEISEDTTWNIVGGLLSSGTLESFHDEVTGEMKLCEIGKIYSIMDLEKKRKRAKFHTTKNNKPILKKKKVQKNI
jgi:hypothetical protein